MPEPTMRLVSQPALAAAERAPSGRLRVAVLPPHTAVQLQVSVRTLPAAAATSIRGVSLPRQPNTWAGLDPVISWIAPDAWLLQSTRFAGQDLVASVRSACAALPCTVTDLSDAFVMLALEGTNAAAVLKRGCGLDLSEAAFGTGACARTRLAQCQILLRRVAPARFEVVVDCSLARYLQDWLLDVAAGLL